MATPEEIREIMDFEEEQLKPSGVGGGTQLPAPTLSDLDKLAAFHDVDRGDVEVALQNFLVTAQESDFGVAQVGASDLHIKQVGFDPGFVHQKKDPSRKTPSTKTVPPTDWEKFIEPGLDLLGMGITGVGNAFTEINEHTLGIPGRIGDAGAEKTLDLIEGSEALMDVIGKGAAFFRDRSFPGLTPIMTDRPHPLFESQTPFQRFVKETGLSDLQISPEERQRLAEEGRNRSILEQVFFDPFVVGAPKIAKGLKKFLVVDNATAKLTRAAASGAPNPRILLEEVNSAPEIARSVQSLSAIKKYTDEVIKRASEAGIEVVPVPEQIAQDAFTSGVVYRSPAPNNFLGIGPVEATLTRQDRLQNMVNMLMPDQIVSKITGGKKIFPADRNVLVAPKIQQAEKTMGVIEAYAVRLSELYGGFFRATFKFDGNGGIPKLAGIVGDIPGAPTLQDVAARLPLYDRFLTSAQRDVLKAFKIELEPYRNLMDEVDKLGMNPADLELLRTLDPSSDRYLAVLQRNSTIFGQRADIMDGGFYIPRGNASKVGEEEWGVFRAGEAWGGGRAKLSAGESAKFDSQAQGMLKGFEYLPIEEVLYHYVRNMGRKIVDKDLGTYFRTLTGPDGNLLGKTPSMRAFEQNKQLIQRFEFAQNNVQRLKGLLVRMEGKLGVEVNRFLHDPSIDPEDIDDLIDALDIRVGDNLPEGFIISSNTGQSIAEVRVALDLAQDALKKLRLPYRTALKNAEATLKQGGIDLAAANRLGLHGREFPPEIAHAINKSAYIKGLGDLEEWAYLFNSFYRGMRATGDNSAVGIQGWMALMDNPVGAMKAMRANIAAFYDPRVLGEYILQHDLRAIQRNLPTSAEKIKEGLHIGGSLTEFTIGTGAFSGLSKVPGIREANRAFGTYLDANRLDWSNKMISDEIKKGRTWQELVETGDAKRIMEITNNMTGHTARQTFKRPGDLFLFARRWFVSRVEVLAKGTMGVRPGAQVDQAAARRTLIKMMGYGIMFTEGYAMVTDQDVNWDPRKGVIGEVRVGDKDVTFFGGFQSMINAVLLTLSGNWEQALRGLGSGSVSVLWDILTGKGFTGEEVPNLFEMSRIWENPGMFGAWLLHNSTPFAFDDLPQQYEALKEGIKEESQTGVISAVTGTALEVFGVRATSLTPSERRDVAREEVMRQDGIEVPWEELGAEEQRRINKTVDVVAAQMKLEETNRARESDYQKYKDTLTEIREETQTRLDRAHGVQGSGQQPFGGTKAFREDIDDIMMWQRISIERTRKNFAEALEFLEDLDPSEAAFDVGLTKYLAAVTGEDRETDDVAADDDLYEELSGDYDWNARERRLEESGLSDADVLKYERWLDENSPEIVKRLNEARRQLRPYWDLRDTASDIVEGLRQRFISEGKEFITPTDIWNETLRVYKERGIKLFITAETSRQQLTNIQYPVREESIDQRTKIFRTQFGSQKPISLISPRFAILKEVTVLERILKESWRLDHDPNDPTASGNAGLEILLFNWDYITTLINPRNKERLLREDVQTLEAGQ
jgi:hypothetical protein